jgi:RNA polymerase sigma-70 factor (ECF subfamily)
MTVGGDQSEVVAAAAGDQAAFSRLSARHRRELHVHCYRMLASFDDAEDAVQETFLRAWRRRDQFEAGGLFRAWLYRIATNVCLDVIRRRSRRPVTMRSHADVPWLQPYPDALLDEMAPTDEQPDAIAMERETIELAFLTALQSLPARQRAALIARDVLGWSAAETAQLLDTTVAATNSALQRARATMTRQLPPQRADWSASSVAAEERALLARFIDAHERCDAAAAVAIAAEDIKIAMPPNPVWYDGLDAMLPLLERAFGPDRDGEWRLLPAKVNRMPAAASYLLRPGDTVFRALKLDVLRIAGGAIAEITTFGPAPFPAMGLPATI